MGEVYKALDTRLGRTVAIKILTAGQRERIQHEARAIAALNHPHICVLHDVGPDYLVMEYLEVARRCTVRCRSTTCCAWHRKWSTHWRRRTRKACCTST